jgi:putative transposase
MVFFVQGDEKMSWKERNTMDLRYEFVLRALSGRASITSLCREYNISRKTGYKWIDRFTVNGYEGLENQSRRPLTRQDTVKEDIICKIIRLKQAHMKWGPKKIHSLLLRSTSTPVSLSSVKRILKKSGLVNERKRRKQTPPKRICKRHKAEEPNDIWTVDFKGYWYTKDQRKCEPLTVRDEYSKYILAAQILPNSRTEEVKSVFQRLFKLHGLPKVIKSDNGSPFASSKGIRGLTRLSAWWISLGIEPERIDPGCPSQNGGHERMHRDLKEDIQKTIIGNTQSIQHSLDLWREEFNCVRPHEALDMRSPADVYSKSLRIYTTPELELEYPIYYVTRRISKNGYLRFHKQYIFLSVALKGLTVGISDLDESFFTVYFNYLELGLINKETMLFLPLLGKELPSKKEGVVPNSEL